MTRREWRLLAASLAAGGAGFRAGAKSGDLDAARGLRDRGLLEPDPTVYAPSEPRPRYFRITTAGRAALEVFAVRGGRVR